MPFPLSERVRYERNPLINVVAQFRFPTLLRLQSELPSEFQEKIRDSFPILREQQQLLPTINLPQEFERAFSVALSGRGNKTYDFMSEDGYWVLSLTRDFIGLGCTSYIRWEDFYKLLLRGVEALIEVYSPNFFTRIGLRYQNVIRPSVLQLEEKSWGELINPVLAPEFSSLIGPDIEDVTHQLVLRLEDGIGKVRMMHGIDVVNDTNEQCYIIDNDFFAEGKFGADNAKDRIEKLHTESGKLFRWCITQPLHESMEPHLIGSEVK